MKIAGKTDIGMVRETNQDAFRIAVLADGIGFALVCDGMGGVKGGDEASASAKRIITSIVREGVKEDMTDDELHDLLLRAIYEANRYIYTQSQQNRGLPAWAPPPSPRLSPPNAPISAMSGIPGSISSTRGSFTRSPATIPGYRS